jgi:hypothetical protein
VCGCVLCVCVFTCVFLFIYTHIIYIFLFIYIHIYICMLSACYIVYHTAKRGMEKMEMWVGAQEGEGIIKEKELIRNGGGKRGGVTIVCAARFFNKYNRSE